MDTPKRSHWHTLVKACSTLLQTTSSNQELRAPRCALRNVSNGQSASVGGSSSFDRHKTPAKASQGALSASVKRINLSIRRESSKSYGDLSNLRPRTPPIQSLPAGWHGLHLSPGKCIDDTQKVFSPSYNRQARQALPGHWVTGAFSRHSPASTTEGFATASPEEHPSPLYGMHVSHPIEAEPAAIAIQGLTSGYVQPLDFCVPITRSHPGDEDQRRETLHGNAGRNLAIEHIDISTFWNGLSNVDANELFRVHRAFVSTLEKMLANEFWQIYQQLQQQDSAGNIRPIHTLFSPGIIRGISFCRDQLVAEMVKALYSTNENAAKAKSGFLQLYLVATDALVQYQENGLHDTSITIRMRCDPSSLRPYPIVDAAWVPDSLLFEGLDEFPLEGQIFSIVPKYYSKSAFRPTDFPDNVKYSIEPESRHYSLSWLLWDDDIAGFKGIVPFYSEARSCEKRAAASGRESCKSISHSLKIIVQAVLVDDNGSSIRYERILRTRLTIKVVPWHVNGISREPKERCSTPKAYQDMRLASAAHRFILQNPRRNILDPGRSLSSLSRWRKGAQPVEYVHTGQVGLGENHPTIRSTVTGAATKWIDLTSLTSLAQTQAYLVAKCAELTIALGNIKKQILFSDPAGEQHKTTPHVSDPQESINHIYDVPFDHYTDQSETTTFPPSVSHVSHCASEYLTNASPASLRGKEASFQFGTSARFSALPPPVIGLRMRPRSDLKIVGGDTSDVACNDWNSISELCNTFQSATSEDLIIQKTPSSQEGEYQRHSPEEVTFSSNPTKVSSSPRQHAKPFSTPPMVECQPGIPSASGERGHKRWDRSSREKMSLFKHSQGTRKQLKGKIDAHSTESGMNTLPLLDTKDEASCSPSWWSGDIFYNSFGPLRDLRSSSTLASEDALIPHASEGNVFTASSKDHDLNMGRGGNTDHHALTSHIFPAGSGLDHTERVAKGPSSNSFLSDLKRQDQLYQSPSAPFPPQPASDSSNICSSSSSSDVEFIVEQDPYARKVSRQEQAKSWKLLSQSDTNKGSPRGPETEEVRLSEDEKEAMDEAMQRSLDDLAEGFDDIFLEDSSESNLGDGDL